MSWTPGLYFPFCAGCSSRLVCLAKGCVSYCVGCYRADEGHGESCLVIEKLYVSTYKASASNAFRNISGYWQPSEFFWVLARLDKITYGCCNPCQQIISSLYEEVR